MSFIKVTATQCNAQGMAAGHNVPVELDLNIDLIGGFHGNEVLLRGGTILNLGGYYFTNFRLPRESEIPR